MTDERQNHSDDELSEPARGESESGVGPAAGGESSVPAEAASPGAGATAEAPAVQGGAAAEAGPAPADIAPVAEPAAPADAAPIAEPAGAAEGQAPAAPQGAASCQTCPAGEICKSVDASGAAPAEISPVVGHVVVEDEHAADRDQPLYCVRYGRMGALGLFRCSLGELRPQTGVIIKTERGLEMGCALARAKAGMSYQGKPLQRCGSVRRLATQDDLMQERHLRDCEVRERKFCEERIRAHKLPMKVVGVEHLFGGDRIVFYFLSDGRVDFRDLVKELAHEYQTRIEMRQIGVRDEARLLADFERCGQLVCCRTFIKDFMPISMRMAKLQKATLDPSKISGRCGRLMCCLRYEYETYEELRKNLPRKNSFVLTPEGPGRVIGGDILTQLVKVEIADKVRVVPVESLSGHDLSEEEVAAWRRRPVPPPRREAAGPSREQQARLARQAESERRDAEARQLEDELRVEIPDDDDVPEPAEANEVDEPALPESGAAEQAPAARPEAAVGPRSSLAVPARRDSGIGAGPRCNLSIGAGGARPGEPPAAPQGERERRGRRWRSRRRRRRRGRGGPGLPAAPGGAQGGGQGGAQGGGQGGPQGGGNRSPQQEQNRGGSAGPGRPQNGGAQGAGNRGPQQGGQGGRDRRPDNRGNNRGNSSGPGRSQGGRDLGLPQRVLESFGIESEGGGAGGQPAHDAAQASGQADQGRRDDRDRRPDLRPGGPQNEPRQP